MNRPCARLVGTLARLGLAAVWLVSGALKAARPGPDLRRRPGLRRAAAAAWSRLVAAVLPWLEIALRPAAAGRARHAGGRGACRRRCCWCSSRAWPRRGRAGSSIDCGCFGGGGAVDPGRHGLRAGTAARHRVPRARGLAGRPTAHVALRWTTLLDGKDADMGGAARNEKQRQQEEASRTARRGRHPGAGAEARPEPDADHRWPRWSLVLVVVVAGGWYYLQQLGTGHARPTRPPRPAPWSRRARARSSSTSTRTSSARTASASRSATATRSSPR